MDSTSKPLLLSAPHFSQRVKAHVFRFVFVRFFFWIVFREFWCSNSRMFLSSLLSVCRCLFFDRNFSKVGDGDRFWSSIFVTLFLFSRLTFPLFFLFTFLFYFLNTFVCVRSFVRIAPLLSQYS